MDKIFGNLLNFIADRQAMKKLLIKGFGAVAIAIAAVAAGMQSQEVRDAVCSAPIIEAPAK
jgi:ActR/RegA family two-component response regulator